MKGMEYVENFVRAFGYCWRTIELAWKLKFNDHSQREDRLPAIICFVSSS